MKKTKLLLSIILVAVIVMTVGCNNSDTGNEVSDNSPITVNLLAGTPNGVWYMLSTGIAEALNNNYPGSVIHTAPGAPVPNLLRLNESETEFAFIHSSNAYEAYRGIGQFDSKKENISAVAVFYPSAAQIIFREDFGISSFSEIMENKIPVKISVGPAESSMDITFARIVAEYGYTYDDMTEWGCTIYKKGFADTSEMFSDEVIDGFFLVAGAPTAFAIQLSVNEEMVILDWNQALLDAMHETYGHGYYTIPSGAYTFMNSELKSFSSYTMLGASLETSEQIVYKMTKAIYENLDYIKSLHAALKVLSTETIAMDSGMPLHPGAEKYYMEIGLID